MNHIWPNSISLLPIHCPCLVDPDDLTDIPATYEEYVDLKQRETDAERDIRPFGEEIPLYEAFLGPTMYENVLGDLGGLLRRTQKYMFFGLLQTALGTSYVTINCKHFITMDKWNQLLITTNRLQEYRENVFIEAVQLDSATRSSIKNKLSLLVVNTLKWLDWWETMLRYQDPTPNYEGY